MTEPKNIDLVECAEALEIIALRIKAIATLLIRTSDPEPMADIAARHAREEI